MGQVPRNELMAALSRLYVDETYSDMAFVSGGKVYKLHRAVVCPRSEVFATAFDESGKFKEATTGVMELPDDDPQAVRLMIHYFYHLDYPHVSLYDMSTNEHVTENGENGSSSSAINALIIEDNLAKKEPSDDASVTPFDPEPASEIPTNDTWSGSRKKSKKMKKKLWIPTPSPPPPKEPSIPSWPGSPVNEVVLEPNLILHAQVYALAEKYGIEGLKSLALEKFGSDAAQHWNTEDFLQAAKVVYTSTIDEDRAMRDVVTKTFHDHKTLLRTQLARNFLRDVEGLAYDLLLRVWNGSTWN